MAIIPGQGNSSFTSVSALDKILAELKKIKDVVVTTSGGSATEATQLNVLTELQGINLDTNNLATETTLALLEAFVTGLDLNDGAVSANTLRVVLDSDTKDYIRIISELDRNAGVNTADTLRVVLEDSNRGQIESIDLTTVDSNTKITYDTWDKIPGNSKEFTWTTGPGGTRVVDTILFKTGIATVVTQTFAYTSPSAGVDEVSSITAS